MKQYLLLCFSSFLLFSCQKEISLETTTGGGGGTGGGGTGGGGTGTYYIKCKINGTARNFNYNNMAKVTDLGVGIKGLTLLGSATSSVSNLEGLNLSINFFGASPTAGTYSENYAGTDYVVAGVYNPNSSTVVYGAGLSSSSVLPLEVIITKIDNSIATGTFKGAFYKTDIAGGTISTTDYVTFTEGEFKLPVR